MATTKVGGGVVDLNEQNTDTVFQLPVGSSSFTGTPVAGMIRNNSSISTGAAATANEFYDGTNWVGMEIPVPPINLDFMVLAGGGSGGFATNQYFADNSGGGGAGGLRTSYGSTSGGGGAAESSLQIYTGTVYTITVGGGGNQGNGTDSFISGTDITTITSAGGGMGGADSPSGQPGGCGGASGTLYYRAFGTGTAGQGYNGGQQPGSAFGQVFPAAGGGGTAGGGSGGSSSAAGPGGAGLSVSITGSAVNFGGGGGGALGPQTNNGATQGLGGVGGGGNGAFGSPTPNGANGSTNLGGGGGGSWGKNRPAPSGYPGGLGGSGKVVLRLATADYSGTQTGASVTTDGTDTILSYNGSGTYTG